LLGLDHDHFDHSAIVLDSIGEIPARMDLVRHQGIDRYQRAINTHRDVWSYVATPVTSINGDCEMREEYNSIA
jgi:hypothetical protein